MQSVIFQSCKFQSLGVIYCDSCRKEQRQTSYRQQGSLRVVSLFTLSVGTGLTQLCYSVGVRFTVFQMGALHGSPLTVNRLGQHKTFLVTEHPVMHPVILSVFYYRYVTMGLSCHPIGGVLPSWKILLPQTKHC